MSINKLIFLLIVWSGGAIIHVQGSDLVRKPNIVLIIVDDLKPALGCYGDTFARTPNIDRLAANSFVFRNNHTQQAVCSSARASLLTGKRPDYIMVWNMNTPIRNMISNIVTMPQYFREHGYETAAVGTVFDPRSVDEGHDLLSWSVPYKNIDGANLNRGVWSITDDFLVTGSQDEHDSQTVDGKILSESIRQLDRFYSNNHPFFLAIGFQKPHPPFVAPQKYWDLIDKEKIGIPPYQVYAEGTPSWVYHTPRDLSKHYENVPENGPLSLQKQKELIHGYYACVSFIDSQIGLLIDQLNNRNLLENTIVVICGDHGMHLGDHGIWCEQTNLEAATRTPLIISYGSKFIGKTDAPTELLDIFPSLCELTGIHIPEALDGKSLLPLFNGSKKSIKPFSVSQIARQNKIMGYAFRDERYRYVVWLKDNFRSYMNYSTELIVSRELYDYRTDPLETVNLINQKGYEEVVWNFENWSLNFFIDQKKSHIKGNLIFDD